MKAVVYFSFCGLVHKVDSILGEKTTFVFVTCELVGPVLSLLLLRKEF
jgi:hypothetical protein